MARGPKKHLKRISAPKSWLLDKMGGIFTTRPSQGPHKLRESLPLSIVLKHRLKYAMNGREVTMVLNDKEGGILVDNKIRRDRGFPVGFMDVVNVPKTKENFRVLYDVKGRFVLKPIEDGEAAVHSNNNYSSNYSVSSAEVSDQTRSHTSLLTTEEPSDSHTQISKRETASSTILPMAKSPNGSRLTSETSVSSPVATTSVELVRSPTSKDTSEVTILPTSRTPTERPSPPERKTFS